MHFYEKLSIRRKKKSEDFATNSNFPITTALQSNTIDLRYFKL